MTAMGIVMLTAGKHLAVKTRPTLNPKRECSCAQHDSVLRCHADRREASRRSDGHGHADGMTVKDIVMRRFTRKGAIGCRRASTTSCDDGAFQKQTECLRQHE